MQKNGKNKKVGIRVAAAVLALAIIAPMPGVFGTNAAAATSLDGIEQIKSKGHFSVLEIVPEKDTGSIGYYVGGQEPTVNWMAALSGKDYTDRAKYANALLGTDGTNGTAGLLETVGLMGTGDAYPLVKSSSYQEYLPWAENIPDEAVEVALDYPERTKVTGTFEENTSGDFIKNSTYIDVGKKGSHVEKALYYKYGNNADKTYYYPVTFTRVVLDSVTVESYKNTPLYVLKNDRAIPYYDYAGTLANGDFIIDLNINNASNDPNKKDGFGYFVATADLTKVPVIEWVSPELKEVDFATEIPCGTTLFVEKEGKYVPVLVHEDFKPADETSYYKLVTNTNSYSAVVDGNDPYRPIISGENGTHIEQIDGYLYVGNKTLPGIDRYSLISGSDQWNVIYDMVYVTGGYTNNEWFKRYVLDIPGDDSDKINKFSIIVNSVTPDELNSYDPKLLDSLFSSYNLVVASAGFYLNQDLGEEHEYKPGDSIEYKTDISAAVATALSARPRVVDTRIKNAPNLLNLKDSEVTSPAVTAKNIYNFMPDDVRTALATNKFHTAFTDTTPYAVVVEEIAYENELRGSNSVPLSSDISMATCIRYIINTHREPNQKTSLKVLDIQPVAKYDGSTGPLTVAKVKSWLTSDAQAHIGNNITITHMSTAALIGKVEDITEQYDLIYIGADEVNDTLPENMYYSNIGTEVDVTGRLTGLLDTDNTTVPRSNRAEDDYRTGKARYSGNDLTIKKRNELIAFANARMPIILSSNLINDDEARPESQWSVEISKNGNVLTAEPQLPDGISANPSFQWKRYKTDSTNPTHSNVSQTESIELGSAANGYTYYCEVTIWVDNKPSTAVSDYVQVKVEGTKQLSRKDTGSYKNWTCKKGNSNDNSKASWFPDKNITLTSTATHNNLTVSMGQESSLKEATVKTHQWYKYKNNSSEKAPNGTSQTLSLSNTASDYYYCVITVECTEEDRREWWGSVPGDTYTLTYTSPAYKVVPGPDQIITTEVENENGLGTIPEGVAGDNSLENVDHCSEMYKALDSFWQKTDEDGNNLYPNVMAESAVTPEKTGPISAEVRINQNTLVKHLNLSRPSIVWYGDATTNPAAYPKEYSGTTISPASTYNCGGELYFTFQIENPTDPSPLTTRYQCFLYIDQNGDGRHSDEEQIGIDYIGQYIGAVTDGKTKDVTDVPFGAVEVVNNQFSNITYTVQKNVDPEKFSGLVAWKLAVKKVGDDAAHASRTGFAYISPDSNSTDGVVERTELRILQIATGIARFGNKLTDYPDLSTPKEDPNSNKNWQDVVKKNNAVGSLNAFQKLYYELYEAGMYDIEVDMERTSKFEGWTQAEVFAFLNGDGQANEGYEMIMLGFGDCFGELTPAAAAAVVQYIETGKAVLFTHDTTSYWNLDDDSHDYLDDGNHPYWGYTFNTIIRDAVGLDRYGVTNAKAIEYGIQKGTGGQILGAEVTDLETKRYTLAYEPSFEDEFTSAGQTQGYTNPIINEYAGTQGRPDTGNPYTTKVSQVNRGQITEFPYHLPDTFTISQTHNQYYQLNMNANDVVVWYCLTADNTQKAKEVFSTAVNDVTNGYYIYNRGNITYSGAGHSNDLGDNTTFEEKLFVNTMIAAYRAGNGNPTINFKTANNNHANALLIPTEFTQTTSGDKTITSSTIVGENLNIYFTLEDPNLTANKSIAVQLSYDVVDADGKKTGTATTTLDSIYRVDTGMEPTSLNNNILYRTTVPDVVLTQFVNYSGDDTAGYQIHLVVTTTLNPDTPKASTYSGSDDLTLKKLGLLRLE